MKSLKLIIIGLASGLLNGFFGAGGGIMAVPLLQKAGVPTEKSHATAIDVILPLTLVSSLLYLKLGSATLNQALPYIPLGLAGAVAGSFLLPRIKTKWLHKIFGVIVLYSAVRLFFS